MTKQLALAVITFCALAAHCCTSHAERFESSEDATHVVTGTVQAVFTRETATEMQYIVEIKVATVEQPKSVKPGDLLQVYCFQAKTVKVDPDATVEQKIAATLGTVREGGHKMVPKEGQQVRVLAKTRHGRLEGLYPDWCTVVKKTPVLLRRLENKLDRKNICLSAELVSGLLI